MIRTLLIAGVVLVGTASSATGSIIVPSLGHIVRVEKLVDSTAGQSPELPRFAPISGRDSLANSLCTESTGGQTSLCLADVRGAWHLASPSGNAIAGMRVHAPTAPSFRLLRPPRAA